MSDIIINEVKNDPEYSVLKNALFVACKPKAYDLGNAKEKLHTPAQRVTKCYTALKAIIAKINEKNSTNYTISSPIISAILNEILDVDEEVSWFYHDEICQVFKVCHDLKQALNDKSGYSAFMILNTFHEIFCKHKNYETIFEEVIDLNFKTILQKINDSADEVIQYNILKNTISQLENNINASKQDRFTALYHSLQTISQNLGNPKKNTLNALIEKLFNDNAKEYLTLMRYLYLFNRVITLYNNPNTSVIHLCKEYEDLRKEFETLGLSLDSTLQTLHNITIDDIENKIQEKFQGSGLTKSLQQLINALQTCDFNSAKIMISFAKFRAKLVKVIEDSQALKNNFADHELIKPIIDTLAADMKIKISKEQAALLAALANGIMDYSMQTHRVKNNAHQDHLAANDHLLTFGKLATDIIDTGFYVEDNLEEKSIFDFDSDECNYLPMQQFIDIDIAVSDTINDDQKKLTVKNYLVILFDNISNGSLLDIIFALHDFYLVLENKLEEEEKKQLLKAIESNCHVLVSRDKAREIYAGLCSYTLDNPQHHEVFFNESQALIKNIVEFKNQQNKVKNINAEEDSLKQCTNKNSAILDSFKLINQTETFYQNEDSLIDWVVGACATLSYYFVRYGEKEMWGHDQHAVVEFMLLKMISVLLTKELSTIEKYKAIIDTFNNIQVEKGFVFNAINQILSEVKEIKSIIADPNSPTFIALKTHDKITLKTDEQILEKIADTPAIGGLYARYHWVKEHHEINPYDAETEFEDMPNQDGYNEKSKKLKVKPLSVENLTTYRQKMLNSANLPSLLNDLGSFTQGLINLCSMFTRVFRRVKHNFKLSNNVVNQLETWGFTANGKNKLPKKSKIPLIGEAAIQIDHTTDTFKTAAVAA